MRSNQQHVLLSAISQALRPVVSLVLKSGIGYGEFVSVVKKVFVDVATAEYGLRGRPTNVSRVAAMTGLSRKEIGKIRKQSSPDSWTPAEAAPASTVLHHWHYDENFSDQPGIPRALPFEGDLSFSALVKRYVGDIPAGALRMELKRAEAISEAPDGLLTVNKRYFHPTELDDDFVRNLGFSLKSLAETLLFNAELVSQNRHGPQLDENLGRFERFAWAEYLSERDMADFRAWVRREGAAFVERADDWIGSHELPREQWDATRPRAIGVGVYFFQQDS